MVVCGDVVVGVAVVVVITVGAVVGKDPGVRPVVDVGGGALVGVVGNGVITVTGVTVVAVHCSHKTKHYNKWQIKLFIKTLLSIHIAIMYLTIRQMKLCDSLLFL